MKAKNKKQFRQEHESEILLYEAARKALNELSGGEKIPTLKQLRAEKEELTAKKNEQYESYSFSRAKYRELLTIQANVQSILRDTPEAIGVADKQLRDAEKRQVRISVLIIAVVAMLVLIVDNMKLSEIGMAALFVYLPIICLIGGIVLLVQALMRKRKGNP